MTKTSYPPVSDPETVPAPTYKAPDSEEPVEDPDSGALPMGEPDDDDAEDEPEDEPMRA
jgi:hypothetical protein